MAFAIEAKYDGKCGSCAYPISKGEAIQMLDGSALHARCVQDVEDGHVVPWITADSINRAEQQERELARIAPLAKQGKCPKCFIELPATGVCDEHGRVE